MHYESAQHLVRDSSNVSFIPSLFAGFTLVFIGCRPPLALHAENSWLSGFTRRRGALSRVPYIQFYRWLGRSDKIVEEAHVVRDRPINAP